MKLSSVVFPVQNSGYDYFQEYTNFVNREIIDTLGMQERLV